MSLQLPGTALLPFGGGHFLNGAELEGALGAEVGEQIIEEVLEAVGIFAVEDFGAWEELPTSARIE